MGKALISVIIPVYNAECYIERCLSSVLENTYVKKQASGLLRLCRKQLENDKFMSLKKKIALWVASTSPSLFRLALVMRDPSYVKWEKQIKQK